MTRKIVILIILSAFVFLAACGTEESSSKTGSEEKDSQSSDEKIQKKKGKIEDEEFDKVHSDPKKYKGYEVEFIGQVFTEPEKDDDGVYLQVYADPENFEKNIIVGIDDPELDISTDDYVKISGVIKDEFEGENAFGGELSVPMVLADNIEVIDYVTAISPTIKTIDIGDEQEQHGYVVQVDKIEIAKNMTRVYVKITNKTDDKISFYSFNTKLLIENKQLEEDDSFYDTGLPELQSEILPGVETKGVIMFPKIDENISNLKLHVEGSSDDYELDIKPFEFDIIEK